MSNISFSIYYHLNICLNDLNKHIIFMNKKGVFIIKKNCFKVLFGILCLFTISLFLVTTKVHAYGWGFTRNDNHASPDIGSYASIIEGTNSYYLGDVSKKVLYLTFDAGYDNGVLDEIIKVLDEKKIHASFFITGDFIKRFPDLVIKLESHGHLLCNHSYSHKSINKMSKEELKADLEKIEKAYYDLTNKELAKYFRPPKGDFDKESLLYLSNLGYKNIFWSMAHYDWDVNKQMSVEKTCSIVLNNLHNGAIMLMHSVSIANARSLPIIIDKAISEGYTFELLTAL